MEETNVEKGMGIFLDVFRRADKRDDGKISWEEFVSFFADGVMGKEELRSLFEEIDTHNTNYIDPQELCNYFSQHLGPMKDIFCLIDDLNIKVSNVLQASAKTYPQSSRSDQFVTRFLTGLVSNQIAALQVPLDTATEAMDQQAKNESTDIIPVQADDVKVKSKEGAIIPGRVVRRAKRQTSSQMSNDGTTGPARVALEGQVDRLALLLDKLEHRVNLDGIVDEELDVTEDKKVLLLQKEMTVKDGELEQFKEALRSYVNGTNCVQGSLSVTVRSYKDLAQFSIYEVWTSEDDQTRHQQSEVGQKFEQSLGSTLEGPVSLKHVLIPANWWKRD